MDLAQWSAQNISMNDTKIKTCVDISNLPTRDLLMAIYILAFVLGVIINLITLGPIIQQVRNHNVLGVYLLNLAISDLLYVFTMPLWIYYFYNGHRWLLDQWTCRLAGFIFYSNLYISIYLLCCISLDRCLTVMYPMWARASRRCSYAWLVCTSVTLAVMIIHALVLTLDSLDAPLDKDGRCYEHHPMPFSVARMNLLRVGIGFVFPLLVLATCYWNIFSTVRRSEGMREEVKSKVRRLSVAVIAIFSVCFAPYHLLLMARSLTLFWMQDKYCDFEQQIHFYFSCALAVSSLNSVIDPVLYVLTSNGVKEDLRLCLCSGRWGRSVPCADTKMTLQYLTST